VGSDVLNAFPLLSTATHSDSEAHETPVGVPPVVSNVPNRDHRSVGAAIADPGMSKTPSMSASANNGDLLILRIGQSSSRADAFGASHRLCGRNPARGRVLRCDPASGGYAVAMKLYHVTTFGCQMNEHDSERMKGMLESLGYAAAAERADADLILFNTCSIRESADSRFIAHLGEAKRLKRERPERIVGVGGCWAQSVKDEVFERFPFVDVAFGPGQVHKLAEFLTSDSLTAQGFFEFEGFTGHLPARRERPFQGWVQISVGCNCACSYCIVPSTRGREVSRPPDELVAEVRAMAADGVKEVTLLGQNVNSYGRDLKAGPAATDTSVGRTGFAGLLALLDGIDGIERIRYTSPHPKDMREDVIRAHAELASVCEHIHLPLQSGSSRVLKAMRRTYDRERYLQRVAMIREHVPDAALTTDIIVGFPGETDADFRETLEVVEEVGYDAAFTFIFSPRRGTEAAAITEGLVPHPVKVERMQELLEIVQRRARERAQRFVGRTLEVLVEGTSRTDPERLRGRTRHNKAVNFTGLAAPGELTEVEIVSATSQTLAGEELLLARAE
jgi:tRNA-2-methylthio-N6-dimethylallyladenosine synthase